MYHVTRRAQTKHFMVNLMQKYLNLSQVCTLSTIAYIPQEAKYFGVFN